MLVLFFYLDHPYLSVFIIGLRAQLVDAEDLSCLWSYYRNTEFRIKQDLVRKFYAICTIIF